MTETNNTWRVLYVKSRHEKKVHDLLLRESIESYLPLVKTLRRWSDRQKVLELPLFPNYLFIRAASCKDSSRVMSINGVFSYVRCGPEYAIVTEKEMEKIRFITELEEVLNIEKNTSPKFKIGEKRKIKFKEFKNLECEILRADNNNKVLINIGSLKQNIIATVPADYLED